MTIRTDASYLPVRSFKPILFVFLNGCYLNSSIALLNSNQLSSKDGDSAKETPILKLVAPSTQVPEGFPYYGVASVENADTTPLFSLVDCDCLGLAINQSTGVLSGVVEQTNGSQCRFKVKSEVDRYILLSDEVLVNTSSGLDLSFSQSSILLRKGDLNSSLQLNLSSPAPFDTYLTYRLFSTNDRPGYVRLNSSSDLDTQGKIFIPAGATSVNLEFGVPMASTKTGIDHQLLSLEDGAIENKPKLKLDIYENQPPTFDVIAVGVSHTCGIASGELYCWGDNYNGKIGNGSGSSGSVTSPIKIGASTTWQHVSLGLSHTCGIDAGKLYCWGEDSYGQLGNGSGSSADINSPQQIGSSSSWQSVSSGFSHTCGIDAGKLYCWGSDSSGNLGTNVGGIVEAPSQVGASTTWQEISSHINNTCGIDSGRLFCWGSDSSEQIGNGLGQFGNVRTPLQVGSSTMWEKVAVGDAFVCGIDSGKLFCWGQNQNGQLGNGNSSYLLAGLPMQVGTSTAWQKISAGASSVCGIQGGNILCWGNNSLGRLGNGSAAGVSAYTPELLGTFNSGRQVSIMNTTACGIDEGRLYCWGNDMTESVGNGSNLSADVTFPEGIGYSTQWQSISVGYSHTCGINSGKLYCWGSDFFGQLGNGATSTANVGTPQQISTDITWQRVSSGDSHTCGINAGKLYCWGSDSEGQIGNGSSDTADMELPAQVGTSASWQEVSAGETSTCGIDAGKLYCWGSDYYGEIGNGAASTNNIESAEQIGASVNWTAISVGAGHACGIDSGKLYCWGNDGDEQIGNGSVSTTNVESPEQIGASSDWLSISAGSSHSCGIDAGKLFCWGSNYDGEVGVGDLVSLTISAPSQVGSSSLWQKIVAGSGVSCGIEAGRFLCWGNNSQGQRGKSVDANSPSMLIDF